MTSDAQLPPITPAIAEHIATEPLFKEENAIVIKEIPSGDFAEMVVDELLTLANFIKELARHVDLLAEQSGH
ncbi:MAG TPA: hypothetical protein VEH29_16580 [Acidimicrobiales bacterium]|nr:hypothetical protein [Acidimicrobiales bacterium]